MQSPFPILSWKLRQWPMSAFVKKARHTLRCVACAGKIGRMRFPKPFLTLAVVTSLSAAGGIWAENAILQNRLPMEEEFSLLSACIETEMLRTDLRASERVKIEQEVMELCVCTFSKALNTTPDISEVTFQTAVKDGFKKCKEDDGWF